MSELLIEDDCLIAGHPRFLLQENAGPILRSAAISAWRAAIAGFDSRNLGRALAQVDGSFAIGLRETGGRTILAVDRFAVCTLVYRVANGQIEFAARADLLGEKADLDPQGIFDYLYSHAIPSPRTIFSGVHRLPPGHYAVFENGALTVTPYWQPRFSEPASPDFETLKEEFRSLMKAAVERQRDDGKPACFLSGGTDSSTVAGYLAQSGGQRAATYSIGFEADGYDEMAYARLAAKRFGTEHHEYYVTPDDLVRSIPAVAAFYDQPFGNSSALPAHYCARMARDDGVTRILAGDGGDELFGGNSRYAKQRIFGWYGLLPQRLRHGLMEPFFGSAPVGRVPLLKKGSSYVEQAKVPMPDRLQMYNLLLRLGVDEVLSPSFLAQVDVELPIEAQRAVWRQSNGADTLNRTLALDWRYTLAESDLPKVCGTTRMAGIEVGFPMLDAALVDFSMRLPVAYKLKGLRLRWFFKEALRGFLPDEILVKKKQGFGLPFGVWVSRHEPLRALAVDSLHTLAKRGIVRPDFIKKLIKDYLPTHPHYYGEMVWILMMLEQWLRHHRSDFRLGGSRTGER